ncbi:MAG: hypothetical protein ACKO5R_09480 [Planctomycetaceae bacterium]
MTRRRWSTRGLSMVASGLIGGIAVVAGAARGDGPPAADPALEAILSEHAADVERLERRFRAARGERIEATLGRLKTLQDDHCRAARLDEALAVREAIRRLERGTDAPAASAPPAAANAGAPAQGAAQAPPQRAVPKEAAKPRAIPLTPLVPARPRVPPRQAAPEAAPEAAPDPKAVPPVAPPPAVPAVPAERGPARRPFD